MMLEVVVDMAKRVVIVSITLAGADLWSSQKDIQEKAYSQKCRHMYGEHIVGQLK